MIKGVNLGEHRRVNLGERRRYPFTIAPDGTIYMIWGHNKYSGLTEDPDAYLLRKVHPGVD